MQDPEKAKRTVMKFLSERPFIGQDELEIRQKLALLPEWEEFRLFLGQLVAESFIKPKEQKVGNRMAVYYRLTEKGQEAVNPETFVIRGKNVRAN